MIKVEKRTAGELLGMFLWCFLAILFGANIGFGLTWMFAWMWDILGENTRQTAATVGGLSGFVFFLMAVARIIFIESGQ